MFWRRVVEDFGRDLRLASRNLWRAPAFAAAAIATLAIGIAGTTVMFALVHGVLLRPLPVHDQDRLIVAWKELRKPDLAHYSFGDVDVERVARDSGLLLTVAGVSSHGTSQSTIVVRGEPVHVMAAPVTGRFFDVLGVRPLIGRTLDADDDVEGAERVLVLSHGVWQRHYGGAPDVIGRQITLDESPFTIVGVMPRELDFPAGVEVWRTTRSFSTRGAFGDAARREVDLVARLQPGVTIEQATSELAALIRHYEADAPPAETRGLTPVVRPLAERVVGNVRPVLLALLAAAGLVLLIATANVANLLLMRGEARRAEVAVRAALGARRSAIVRQVFAESLVLTGGAAGVGLAVAWWSLRGLAAWLPSMLPRVESVRFDPSVVLFTTLLALVTAMLASLTPALSSVRLDLVSQLSSGGRSLSGPATRHGRRALVVAQVALAVMVVAVAGLLARTMLYLQTVDTGFATDRLVFVDLVLPRAATEGRGRHRQLLDDIVARLEAVPVVTAVAPLHVPPLTGGASWWVPVFTAEGQSVDQAAANPALSLESVHARHFETIGIPLTRGRAFSDADRDGTLPVAIVSEDVAAVVWPGIDPVGKRLKIGGPDSTDRWYTVVGVAGTVRYGDITRSHPTLYLPDAQFIVSAEVLAIRTAAPLSVVATVARDRIRAVNADIHVTRVTPFHEARAGLLAPQRFNALLLGLFGAAALLLAAIGLYAVIAASVRQRDREIGIRIALGATAAHVRRLVLGESLRLAGAGVLVGLAGAVATTHLVRGLLHGVEPLDPLTLSAAVAGLLLAAALAACIPMRQAVRLNPATLLRKG
ncbi:MAG: ABC transporter permease [Acidobacteria bacterium]|nr:ABC transporter permease [Acidobacteriota bacterium]